MTAVRVFDIDQLEAFFGHLRRFNGDLKAAFQGMEADSYAQKDNWHDVQYERFIRDFEEFAEGIKRYLQRSEDHEAYLHQLLERLRAVEGTHLR